jgi:hypothetical protein
MGGHDGPMSTPEPILAVLRELVLDEAERGITAERFRTDPSGWQAAAEDWGVSTIPIHAGPDAAQADAEHCRAALVRAGWQDQADAGVSATFDQGANGWRGAINLDFGLLPPIEYGAAVTYGLAGDGG